MNMKRNVIDMDIIRNLLMYENVSLYAIEKGTGISRSRLSQVVNDDCIEKLSIENGLKLMSFHYQLRNKAIASAYAYLKAGNYEQLVAKVMDLPMIFPNTTNRPTTEMNEFILADLARPNDYEKKLSWWIAQHCVYPYKKYVDSLTRDELIQLADHANPILRRDIALVAEKNKDLELLKQFVYDEQEAVSDILLRVEELEDWLIEHAPKQVVEQAEQRKKFREYLRGERKDPFGLFD